MSILDGVADDVAAVRLNKKGLGGSTRRAPSAGMMRCIMTAMIERVLLCFVVLWLFCGCFFVVWRKSLAPSASLYTLWIAQFNTTNFNVFVVILFGNEQEKQEI